LNYKEAENILDIYSLEEILELNDCTIEDVLCFLVDEEFIITLPDPNLLDLE